MRASLLLLVYLEKAPAKTASVVALPCVAVVAVVLVRLSQKT